MKLHTPHTYSLESSGPQPSYPVLDRDLQTDVLVIGSGISGALTAWTLQRAGFSCSIIDKRRAATGSTAASTSLLQYELDSSLCMLSDRIGRKAAEESYLLCYEAIDRLRAVCAACGAADLFEPRPSLQWARSRKDLATLREETARRKAIGLDVDLVGPTELQQQYFLEKPGALLSRKAAQIDAYRLTHRLLQDVQAGAGAVYERTEAAHIQWEKSGVRVQTTDGHVIRAGKLVIACGYESQRYLPKEVEELFVTYVLLSKPVDPGLLWHRRALLWDTGDPYLYLRTTPDQRVIIGGKDHPFDGRTDFPQLRRRSAALEASLRRLMPELAFEPDYSWAGIFAGTPDTLPFIGSVPGQPHTAYALGFGGNGILFSVLAADIITQQFSGHKPREAALFSFDRV
ncbi:NAD(P)/FAD-dependent oxidoreductase [Flaviaesturariibacter terrae]